MKDKYLKKYRRANMLYQKGEITEEEYTDCLADINALEREDETNEDETNEPK